MRNIILLATFLLLLSCGGSSVKTVDAKKASQSLNKTTQTSTNESLDQKKEASSTQASIVYSSKEDVRKHIEYLASDELNGRQTGTDGIEKAASYIEGVFKAVGVEPLFDTYRDGFKAKGIQAYNVVGVVSGNDAQLKDEYIVIGAHYDHIGQGKDVNGDVIANGANDNASGTTAVIELAKYFAETKVNKRSIIFALFSAEEMGLLGSKHLADKLKNQEFDLYTVFNIEMIGVPMVAKDHLVYLTGYENSNMASQFNNYVGKTVLGFLPKAKEFNLFKRSDNYPFYEVFKIPAQTVSTFDFTNFDYYHHVDDETSQIDVEHVTQVINALIPGLEKMSATPTKEISLNE